jgi:NADH:ubiquinone oxidoreductase subunit E
MTRLDQFVDAIDTRDKASSLIKVLYEAQEIFGYLPKDVIFYIGEKLNVPAAHIYGVITFYSFFTTKPKGKCQIKVCMGTACFVCGAEKIAQDLAAELNLNMGETSEDLSFSIDAVRCVGACGLAPAVLVNEHVHARVAPQDIKKLLRPYRKTKKTAATSGKGNG